MKCLEYGPHVLSSRKVAVDVTKKSRGGVVGGETETTYSTLARLCNFRLPVFA